MWGNPSFFETAWHYCFLFSLLISPLLAHPPAVCVVVPTHRRFSETLRIIDTISRYDLVKEVVFSHSNLAIHDKLLFALADVPAIGNFYSNRFNNQSENNLD